MAVVYRLILGQDSEGRSSVLVTNDLMEQFGITHEQLHEELDAILGSDFGKELKKPSESSREA